MGATERFNPDEVQRILGLTGKQLDYWDRLRLVSLRKEQGNRFYDFRDLIGLRTVKQLVEEGVPANRSEEHTSELQSRLHLVCRLLLEKKKKTKNTTDTHTRKKQHIPLNTR